MGEMDRGTHTEGAMTKLNRQSSSSTGVKQVTAPRG